MAATPEILSKLNIGSGMNNSEIIAALVNAEKAPALDRIEKDENDICDRDIFNALVLISEYMKKNIFLPNNLNLPLSRQNFINYFK